MSDPNYMHEFCPNRKGICILCHGSKEERPHVRWQQDREDNPTRSERLQRERIARNLSALTQSVQGEELRASLVRVIEILEAR